MFVDDFESMDEVEVADGVDDLEPFGAAIPRAEAKA